MSILISCMSIGNISNNFDMWVINIMASGTTVFVSFDFSLKMCLCFILNNNPDMLHDLCTVENSGNLVQGNTFYSKYVTYPN